MMLLSFELGKVVLYVHTFAPLTDPWDAAFTSGVSGLYARAQLR